ncbi:MAG: ERF family protein [Prevotella sp.]|nr:ERF family protein [Prevotella sp.]
METLISKITAIQGKLKAPRNQFNKFGNYYYRSCEDILEAVKPLLVEQGLLLTITDDIVVVGNRFYVKATVKVTDGKNEVTNTAFAREEETKKGMDGSQLTGCSSSYARKYALNGMFCIDDTKDCDALQQALAEINAATSIAALTAIHKSKPELHQVLDFMNALSSKKKMLKP